uniref:hypothetical protein n=1 Tax=Nonomuraea sp. CA-251285 TaxID=3240002 RepID=UPI003F49509C
MTRELRAADLVPGTGFEVVVKDDGTFYVQVFNNWEHRASYYDGEGHGATFTEAASAAIAQAEEESDDDE